MNCVIYKSSRKADTYLYVLREDALSRVPNTLLEMLGPLKQVMDLELHAGRRLASADVEQVMSELSLSGYFLQMPPAYVLH